MKKIFTVLLISTVICLFSLQSHAELFNRGTDSLGNQLIYDSDLNVTWYDLTNSAASWQDQVDWASGLTVNFGGDMLTGWRLPTTTQPDSNCDLQLDPGGGLPLQGYRYNCTGSEMGHLYYTELGNSAGGAGGINMDDFQHLQAVYYWSGTAYAPDTDFAWRFSFDLGYQRYGDKVDDSFSAIAVREGDVTVVPEPVSSTLFVLGVGMLAGRRYLKKKK